MSRWIAFSTHETEFQATVLNNLVEICDMCMSILFVFGGYIFSRRSRIEAIVVNKAMSPTLSSSCPLLAASKIPFGGTMLE